MVELFTHDATDGQQKDGRGVKVRKSSIGEPDGNIFHFLAPFIMICLLVTALPTRAFALEQEARGASLLSGHGIDAGDSVMDSGISSDGEGGTLKAPDQTEAITAVKNDDGTYQVLGIVFYPPSLDPPEVSDTGSVSWTLDDGASHLVVSAVEYMGAESMTDRELEAHAASTAEWLGTVASAMGWPVSEDPAANARVFTTPGGVRACTATLDEIALGISMLEVPSGDYVVRFAIISPYTPETGDVISVRYSTLIEGISYAEGATPDSELATLSLTYDDVTVRMPERFASTGAESQLNSGAVSATYNDGFHDWEVVIFPPSIPNQSLTGDAESDARTIAFQMGGSYAGGWLLSNGAGSFVVSIYGLDGSVVGRAEVPMQDGRVQIVEVSCLGVKPSDVTEIMAYEIFGGIVFLDAGVANSLEKIAYDANTARWTAVSQEDGGVRILTPFYSVFIPQEMYPQGFTWTYNPNGIDFSGAYSGNYLSISPADGGEGSHFSVFSHSPVFSGTQGSNFIVVDAGLSSVDQDRMVSVVTTARYDDQEEWDAQTLVAQQIVPLVSVDIVSDGSYGTLLKGTPTLEQSAQEWQYYQYLDGLYARIGEYNQTVAEGAASFNETYATADTDRAAGGRQGAYQFHLKMDGEIRDLEALGIPETSVYYPAAQDMIALLNDLMHRAEVVSMAWAVVEGCPGDTEAHIDEIMAPIVADNDENGVNVYKKDFDERYPDAWPVDDGEEGVVTW